jgi:putative ABC transport system ATP-binding protein
MPEALIQTEGLSKDYLGGQRPIHALRDVDLIICRGEFVAIMGPSGSGKSTLLGLLGCMDHPTSGRYRLDGQLVSSLSPNQLATVRNRKIGLVFQNFNLLARTPALENVELPMLYSDLPASQRRIRARERLARVGLADRAGHLPGQLSGGEQQRVAIARALVNDPLLILADEPTGALDSRTGLDIMQVFTELHRAGHTLVIVTHDPKVAGHAERIIGFSDGTIVDDSPVAADPVTEQRSQLAGRGRQTKAP